VIEDTFGAHAITLPAGDAVLYLSTSLHRVKPLTRGVRLASFLWIQSMICDDTWRTLLFDLDIAINQVGEAIPEHRAVIHHNLLHGWAEG